MHICVDCLQLFLSKVILTTSIKRSGISVPRFLFVTALLVLESIVVLRPTRKKGFKDEKEF